MEVPKVALDSVPGFLDSFDYFMFDCDGVLWHSNDPIPGIKETLDRLRKMGKKLFFVTNNSMKTRRQLIEKFVKLGYEAYEEEVIGTAYVVAQYLSKILKYKGKVYLIGNAALVSEMEQVGIKCTEQGPDNATGPDLQNVGVGFEKDPEIKCVVVGFDAYISFPKATKAASYLFRQDDCLFVSTNPDTQFPLKKKGYAMPGTGSIVKFIETAASRESICVGKPNRAMFDVLKEIHPEIDPKRTLMVGDKLTTDIALAHNIGCKSLFVLTGIDRFEEMEAYCNSSNPEDKKNVPHFCINSLGDIDAMMKEQGF